MKSIDSVSLDHIGEWISSPPPPQHHLPARKQVTWVFHSRYSL